MMFNHIHHNFFDVIRLALDSNSCDARKVQHGEIRQVGGINPQVNGTVNKFLAVPSNMVGSRFDVMIDIIQLFNPLWLAKLVSRSVVLEFSIGFVRTVPVLDLHGNDKQ